MNDDPLSADSWRARISACKRERADLVKGWQVNVDYRRGKPFSVASDSDLINVNLDAPYTRAKHAALFSSVPSVVLTANRDDIAPVMGAYGKRLNQELTKAGVGAAIDEAIVDTINASGIGAVLVSYEERTEAVDVPAVDPLSAALLQQQGADVPTVKGTRITDRRFSTQHLSPDDLLWPVDWSGSDWNKAPWIGRTGRMFWPEAQVAFDLKPEDRDKVCGDPDSRDRIRDDNSDTPREALTVEYDEIFFKLASYSADAKYFDQIHRLVFVHGIDKPVIDEPSKTQTLDPQTGQYLGSCKFPIQILTIEYISDQAIPPSDSALARPQVNELIAHRTNSILQRQRSIPARWFDASSGKLDQSTVANLMRGEWNGLIPVKGNGDSIIGEIKQASTPVDDFRGADTAMRDAALSWGLSSNQAGQFTGGERSATEAAAVQQANYSMIGYQRGRVAQFFCNIADVFSGLLALYADLQIPDIRSLVSEFAYTIRPDSTVLLDAAQRTHQLTQFLNIAGKSGYANVPKIIAEIATLNNLDPAEFIVQPQPQSEPSNVSFRFSGSEDLRDPLVVAMLMKSGQFPAPDEVEAAKQAIIASMQLPQQQPQPALPQQPNLPNPKDLGPGIDRIVKRTEEAN